MTRLEETNFGDLSADAFREAAEDFTERTGTKEEKNLPVIAVENGGGIREAVRNGHITAGDLMTAFPFSNTLYLKKVTPAILYEVMEVSGSALTVRIRRPVCCCSRIFQEAFCRYPVFVWYMIRWTDGK